MTTRHFTHKRRQRQSGQTLVMFVFFMIVLILFVGLGIDIGFAYITKAQLSKAVDAAALAGIKNVSQGTLTAQNVASATFAANYNTTNSVKPGRDVTLITPKFDWVGTTNLTVSATTTINTFFIRILPPWKTLTVSASAQTLRSKLVMSLVLDRSGSMDKNGGSTALPPAVKNFIDLFDDANDQVSMSSFSGGSTVDVTMRTGFRKPIKDAVSAMDFNSLTCSERGLTNGFAQNSSVVIPAGQEVYKVIVFFSDGLANTFYYSKFNCGGKDISYQQELFDPVTGGTPSGCTIPGSILSIDGINTVDTSDDCSKNGMHHEAQLRAERIAFLARAATNIVYAIGFGNPSGNKECGLAPLNPDFLKNLANTPDSKTYNASQPVGDYAIAANAGEIDDVFQQIASKILLRIAR